MLNSCSLLALAVGQGFIGKTASSQSSGQPVTCVCAFFSSCSTAYFNECEHYASFFYTWEIFICTASEHPASTLVEAKNLQNSQLSDNSAVLKIMRYTV